MQRMNFSSTLANFTAGLRCMLLLDNTVKG